MSVGGRGWGLGDRRWGGRGERGHVPCLMTRRAGFAGDPDQGAMELERVRGGGGLGKRDGALLTGCCGAGAGGASRRVAVPSSGSPEAGQGQLVSGVCGRSGGQAAPPPCVSGGVFHGHVPLPHPAHAAGPRSHAPGGLEGHPVLPHAPVPPPVGLQGEAWRPGVGEGGGRQPRVRSPRPGDPAWP